MLPPPFSMGSISVSIRRSAYRRRHCSKHYSLLRDIGQLSIIFNITTPIINHTSIKSPHKYVTLIFPKQIQVLFHILVTQTIFWSCLTSFISISSFCVVRLRLCRVWGTIRRPWSPRASLIFPNTSRAITKPV